jgi:hypothetical protein
MHFYSKREEKCELGGRFNEKFDMKANDRE